MKNLLLKIRRQDTSFFKNLYGMLKYLNTFSLPPIPFIYIPLFYFGSFVKNFIYRILEAVWYVPAFKSIVNRNGYCGKRMKLHHGFPCIEGSNLILKIGNDVSFQNNTLSGGKTFDHPVIEIGDRTHFGWETNISCSKYVKIGDDCIFASFSNISDNNGHPVSPKRRLNKETVNEDEVIPVIIGNNVWISTGAIILKGTVIGDNSIVAANCVLKNVIIPHNSIVYQNIDGPCIITIDAEKDE